MYVRKVSKGLVENPGGRPCLSVIKPSAFYLGSYLLDKILQKTNQSNSDYNIRVI